MLVSGFFSGCLTVRRYNVRLMERWVWRNFGLSVPSDWEMLQFSRNMSSGRCVFADRYQFRLELSWRVVAGPPDFGRTTSDYLAKLQEQGMTGGSRFRQGPWHGVNGKVGGQATTRLGRHFNAESCLVELVFLWPGRKDTGLLRKIAASVEEEPQHGGRFRRWRAFGMDLLAADGLPLKTCTAEPANAEMVFSDEKCRSVERFARRGMVREWLKQPPDEWLRGWVDQDVQEVRTSATVLRGHTVHRLSGERRLPGIGRGRARYDAAAWICRGDGRLYSISCSRAAKSADVEPMLAGGRLSCCAAMELPI